MSARQRVGFQCSSPSFHSVKGNFFFLRLSLMWIYMGSHSFQKVSGSLLYQIVMLHCPCCKHYSFEERRVEAWKYTVGQKMSLGHPYFLLYHYFYSNTNFTSFVSDGRQDPRCCIHKMKNWIMSGIKLIRNPFYLCVLFYPLFGFFFFLLLEKFEIKVTFCKFLCALTTKCQLHWNSELMSQLLLSNLGHLFNITMFKNIRQVASSLSVHIHLYYIKN